MSAEKIPVWLQDIVNQLPEADGEQLIAQWQTAQLRIQELEVTLNEAIKIGQFIQKHVDELTIKYWHLDKISGGKYSVHNERGDYLGDYTFFGAVDIVRKLIMEIEDGEV